MATNFSFNLHEESINISLEKKLQRQQYITSQFYNYPWKSGKDVKDQFDIPYETEADYFITNPPWTWGILNPLIYQLSFLKPTWLLLNADVMHNNRMSNYMKCCVKIISVGRVSWMQNKINGFENCAWFLFNQEHKGYTKFVGKE